MAVENFLRDLSEYLVPGNLSDLTLVFGERSWRIHKLLTCCHSTWFQKAVNSGFEESQSGTITLQDDPEFGDAIDCMVSYFYKADYDVSQYDGTKPLLHAQVATIADKYDCKSLYKLAESRFTSTVHKVKASDWVAIAAFIYSHTTTDSPAHMKLRSHVVSAATNDPVMFISILELEDITVLLSSLNDLTTDLLLEGPRMIEKKFAAQKIFVCGQCRFAHVGPSGCASLGVHDGSSHAYVCPQCGSASGRTNRKHTHKMEMCGPTACSSCDGFHTHKEDTEPYMPF